MRRKHDADIAFSGASLFAGASLQLVPHSISHGLYSCIVSQTQSGRIKKHEFQTRARVQIVATVSQQLNRNSFGEKLHKAIELAAIDAQNKKKVI